MIADGDKPLDLDTIATLSQSASKLLDTVDMVAGSYVLEVSSPGVDRPLTSEKHFRRARGRKAELTLTDGSQLTGRLGETENGHLRVVMAGGAALHLELDALPKPLFKKIVQKRDKYERGVRDLIAAGQRQGLVRSGEPKLQAFALLGALNWVARWYRPGDGDPDQIRHSFREQLLRGLLWQRT